MNCGSAKRLIVVSNRLPYVLENSNRGAWTLKPGSGGLVSALLPVLRDRGGIWIGWSGTSEPVPGSERELPAQLILLAMGFLGPQQEGLLEQLEVERDARTNVARDSS